MAENASDIPSEVATGASENEVTSARGIPRFDALLAPCVPDAADREAGDTHPPSVPPSLGLNSPSIYVVDGVDSETGFQLLGQSKLDQADLDDLLPVKSFPERIDAAPPSAASEIASGYPSSGLDYSFSPQKAPRSPLLGRTEARSSGRSDEPSVAINFVDVRENQRGLHNFSRVKIPRRPESTVKADVAAYFKCSEDIVTEVHLSATSQSAAYILGALAQESLHVVVHHKDRSAIGLLVVDHNCSLDTGLSLCRKWLQQAFGAHYVQPLTLLRQNGTRLDRYAAFSEVTILEELSLLRAETVTLKVLHRVSQRMDKTFYVECYDTDYVQEIKEKFLRVFLEEEKLQHAETEKILRGAGTLWLTCGEKVLQDRDILKAVWTSMRVEDDYSLDHPSAEVTSNDTFHVHFQPADAVLLKVNFKSEARKYQTSESVILLSPRASVQDLRDEISKVTHRDTNSFKVLISGKKLEMKTVLEPFLKTPNCIAVVEQRPKIQLNVVIDGDIANLQPVADGFPVVCMHKYERVEALKREICNRLHVPPYCVDLRGGGHGNDNKTTTTFTTTTATNNAVDLRESDDLRTARLRDGDTILALVFSNRTRFSLRLAPGDWLDVLVDDVSVTTVQQLKDYVVSTLFQRFPVASGCAPQFLSHNLTAEILDNADTRNSRQGNVQGKSELLPEAFRDTMEAAARRTLVVHAILGGRRLADVDTLRDAGVVINSRVVLVMEVKFCFTVSPPGFVPLYFARGIDDYQPPERVMVCCTGKSFMIFVNPEDVQRSSADLPRLFSMPTRPGISPGIRCCPSRLKNQFPPPKRQQHGQQRALVGNILPVTAAATTTTTAARPQQPPLPSPGSVPIITVCQVCKSRSAPSFIAAPAGVPKPYDERSFPRSRSDTFQGQQRASPSSLHKPDNNDGFSGGGSFIGSDSLVPTRDPAPRHSTPIRDQNGVGVNGGGGAGNGEVGAHALDSVDGLHERLGVAPPSGGREASAGGQGQGSNPVTPETKKMRRKSSLFLRVSNSTSLTQEEAIRIQQMQYELVRTQQQQEQHQLQELHEQYPQQYRLPPPQHFNISGVSDVNGNTTAATWPNLSDPSPGADILPRVTPVNLSLTPPPTNGRSQYTYARGAGYYSESDAGVSHQNAYSSRTGIARRQHPGNAQPPPLPHLRQQPQLQLHQQPYQLPSVQNQPPPHPSSQQLLSYQPPPHPSSQQLLSYQPPPHPSSQQLPSYQSPPHPSSQQLPSYQSPPLSQPPYPLPLPSQQQLQSYQQPPQPLPFVSRNEPYHIETPSPVLANHQAGSGAATCYRSDTDSSQWTSSLSRDPPSSAHSVPSSTTTCPSDVSFNLAPVPGEYYNYNNNNNPEGGDGGREGMPLVPVRPAGPPLPYSHSPDDPVAAGNRFEYHYQVDQNKTTVTQRFQLQQPMDPRLQGFPFPSPPVYSNSVVSAQDGPEIRLLPQQDTAFAYVPKNVILMLAKELGHEWARIMHELLDEPVISDYEARHPRDPYRRNFDCLRHWCKSKGSQATWAKLKEVLANNDRQELVEAVENSGYQTAP